MPIHDWTKVDSGIFHDFHHDWITTLKRGLNAGRLPKGYYAMAEQIAGGLGPDVVTLEDVTRRDPNPPIGEEPQGGLAVATAPPKVWHTSQSDSSTRKSSLIAIRHTSDHRVVAVAEIVSPGNKASRYALDRFVSKTLEFLEAGVHLLIIDLFPPGPRDPQGIHGAIWGEVKDEDFRLPPERPLTLASYAGGPVKRAFVEPRAVGYTLPEMPIFLTPERYVPAPLETTYMEAWEGVPAYWRERIERSTD